MRSIWGNMIVKNEDKFIWFAVQSVINYLERLIIYDTGSSDETVKIIQLLIKQYPKKIFFREYGEVDEKKFTKARQEMLDITESDWLLVLDGDEVWWKDSIEEARNIIERQGDNLDFLVSRTVNAIGDIYHYQKEEAGNYKIAGKKGHFNIRAINLSIPGLHIDRPYGKEGYFDSDNKLIQDRGKKKILFLKNPYLHLTHLKRSSLGDDQVMQRKRKFKYEQGIFLENDFKFPEVFYLDRPSLVNDPWEKAEKGYTIRAVVETPIRNLKRKLVSFF